MALLRARSEQPPLTNRGVEVTEASSSGAWMTGWLPHVPRFWALGPGVELTRDGWHSSDLKGRGER